MKTIQKILILTILSISIFSCKDEYTEIYTANKPIYLSYEELREAVKFTTPQPLKKPGKIYFKDDYIYINETFKGIHIIDNSDNNNPKNVGFIEIPGNVDMAIKNNTLYADSYVDLVAIDISNKTQPTVKKRINDILPYTLPSYDESYPISLIDRKKGVVIDWKIEKVSQEIEYHYYPVWRNEDVDYVVNDGSKGGPSAEGNTFGTGGSMARFGLYDNYLYTVDNSKLYTFDVHNDYTPNLIGEQGIGWNIETMFIYDHHIFFGTTTGMLIFDLEIATLPKYKGRFWHASSCDPVVVSDGYAYITLRGGTTCGGDINRLDILDLSEDYIDNKLIASYPMHGPYGLGINGDILFVCDGDAGLKVFDVNDKLKVDRNMIAQFSEINAYDVIPLEDYLFMIGEDGFYQYDYSDLQDIHEISKISIEK